MTHVSHLRFLQVRENNASIERRRHISDKAIAMVRQFIPQYSFVTFVDLYSSRLLAQIQQDSIFQESKALRAKLQTKGKKNKNKGDLFVLYLGSCLRVVVKYLYGAFPTYCVLLAVCRRVLCAA